MIAGPAATRVDSGLAVLTRAGTSFGVSFLELLAARGVRPALLGVERTPFRRRLAMARGLARRIGWRDAARYNARFWAPLVARRLTLGRAAPLTVYDGRAERVVTASDLHARAVIEALADPAIDLVVLAHSGLIRAPILELGKRILNCHPARLPELRGVDVVRWALLEESPLEVTLHAVDAGVDTGPVIERRPFEVRPGDGWRDVEHRAVDVSLELLVAASLDRSLAFRAAEPQERNAGRQRYLMPFATAARFELAWPSLRERRLTARHHPARPLSMANEAP